MNKDKYPVIAKLKLETEVVTIWDQLRALVQQIEHEAYQRGYNARKCEEAEIEVEMG